VNSQPCDHTLLRAINYKSYQSQLSNLPRLQYGSVSESTTVPHLSLLLQTPPHPVQTQLHPRHRYNRFRFSRRSQRSRASAQSLQIAESLATENGQQGQGGLVFPKQISGHIQLAGESSTYISTCRRRRPERATSSTETSSRSSITSVSSPDTNRRVLRLLENERTAMLNSHRDP
jgi:hypothetical protein